MKGVDKMAKFDVTPELATTIKTVRIQNHITSKSVAEHIGKSQAYMSKLEKGDIKSIKESELTSIFKFIFNNNDDFQEFLNSTLGKILATLEVRFSDEEISNQLWFNNYDKIRRMIPIPETLISELVAQMNSLELSPEKLCMRINSNEGLNEKTTNLDQYPFNEWQVRVVDHKIHSYFIKMKVNLDYIEKILERKIISANYVTILSIAYYVFKTRDFGERVMISDDDDRRLMRQAKELLRSHRFFTLMDKRVLRIQAQSESEKDALLSSFDKENNEVINELLEGLQIFSELDIVRVNESLKTFVENLKWDGSFIMKLINIPFYKMDRASFTIKKEILKEIQTIFEKYEDIPQEKMRMEVYD